VHAGDRTADLVEGARARGVYIRDRSTEPGCDGCIRIGTGIVSHTQRCIAAMDEVLCAAR
jgi:histidinol-phosphate aminotransferase